MLFQKLHKVVLFLFGKKTPKSSDWFYSSPGVMENISILVIDESADRAAVLVRTLSGAGYTKVTVATPSDITIDAIQLLEPQLILIDVESPTRDTLEQLTLIRDECPTPVLLLSQDDRAQSIQRSIESGVSAYLTDQISLEQAKPIIENAMATFASYQSLRMKLEETQAQLKDRKVIERAKGIVMEREHLSEEVAYHRMRKFAMDHKSSVAEVARRILKLSGA